MVHHVNCQAGWNTSCHHDCQEKCQQRQIYRWCHPYCRRRRRSSWWKWKRRGKKEAWISTFKKLRSWHPVPSLHGKEMGKQWKQRPTFIFLSSKITEDGDCSCEIKRCMLLGRKAVTNLGSILKNRDIILLTKIFLVKAVVFHVQMWELDPKEAWASKNLCFWTVVLEKTWESLGLQGDPASQS